MYIIVKALFTIKQVELIRIKELTVTTLDPNEEIFVVYVAFLVSFNLSLEVYPFQSTYIVFLKVNKAFISIFSKYADIVDIFFKDLKLNFQSIPRLIIIS